MHDINNDEKRNQNNSAPDINGDESIFERLVRRDAENGDAEAQLIMGHSYLLGEYVEKDEAEAARWFQKSAEQGNAEAQNMLGECYDHGQGVEKNDEKAVHWFEKAAQQENLDALFNLGRHKILGTGCTKNREAGFHDIQVAAERDHEKAQFLLGVCYENGYGVAKDNDKAVEAYEKAVQMGNKPAADNLEKLRKKMSEAREAEEKRREEERAAQIKEAKDKTRELLTIVAAVISGVVFHWTKTGMLQNAADSTVAFRCTILALASAFAFGAAGAFIFKKWFGQCAGVGALASISLAHFSRYGDRYPHTELIFLVLLAPVVLLMISQILKKNKRLKELTSDTDKS